MRFLLLIFMVVMAGCATTNKGLTPKTNGTTCASGNAHVCYKQARNYHFGKDVTNNVAKAIQYYERACALDHPDGCYWAARGYEQVDDPKIKNVPRARVLYQRLCKHKIQKGCHQLGNSYIDYPQHPGEIQKGVALLNKQCHHHAAACHSLGNKYYYTSNLKNDNAAAMRYYKKGCTLNAGASCYQMSRLFGDDKIGGAKNAYKYVDKGCALGNKYACVQKHLRTFYGHGTTKQEKQALLDLANLCKSGWIPACLGLITPSAKGSSTLPPKPKLAFELVSNICHQHNHPRACVTAGTWYDYEKYGTAFDVKKVLFYYQKSCKRRDPAACINLGLMYKQGRGLKPNHKEAFARFKMACTRGASYGCLNMAEMYQDGLGINKNLVKAKQIFTHHCENRVEEACVRLAYWQAKGINGPKDVRAATTKLKRICVDQDGPCYRYGLVLKDAGDKQGAIKVFERQCKKKSVDDAVDSCIELVKLGQTQFKARTEKLKATQCRRLHKAYCPATKQKGDKP